MYSLESLHTCLSTNLNIQHRDVLLCTFEDFDKHNVQRPFTINGETKFFTGRRKFYGAFLLEISQLKHLMSLDMSKCSKLVQCTFLTFVDVYLEKHVKQNDIVIQPETETETEMSIPIFPIFPGKVYGPPIVPIPIN